MKKAGIIIFVIGLLISVFGGFHYVTREKVVDLGDLHITANKHHAMTWSPAVGIAMIAVGAGMYFFGTKEK